MAKKTLKAEYRGEIEIGDMTMSCAVLEDGTRIISENSIHNNLGTSGGKVRQLRSKMEEERGAPIPLFLASKALEPFIDKVFDDRHLAPIEYWINDTKHQGYPAEILPKVCDVWLMARELKTLQPSQLPKAQKAEVLMRGLAHIGITALVDEATGYQYDREKDALQVILKAYISDEIAKWQLTFTVDFYKELFRLWQQPFNPNSIKKPQFVGKLTNLYIYKPLHDGVILDEIKSKTPKDTKGNYKYRFHQNLTDDVGREHLKRQIIEVTALMSICDTKEEFKMMFDKKYSKQRSLLLPEPQKLEKKNET